MFVAFFFGCLSFSKVTSLKLKRKAKYCTQYSRHRSSGAFPVCFQGCWCETPWDVIFCFVLWDLKIERIGPFFSHIAAGIGVKFIQPRLSWSVPHLLFSVSFRIFSWRWHYVTKTSFFFQTSFNQILSLLKSPTPFFKRVSPFNLFFLKPPLFCQVVFLPVFPSEKMKRQQHPPRTTWWITQYTSLPPRDESFLRVADTLGLGLVEIAEPKRGWVMNLGGWWVKGLVVGFGEVGWGWWGGVYTFDIWDCGVSMVWIACECAIWATKKGLCEAAFSFKELSNWVGWAWKKIQH